jgi:hypothetical protein
MKKSWAGKVRLPNSNERSSLMELIIGAAIVLALIKALGGRPSDNQIEDDPWHR